MKFFLLFGIMLIFQLSLFSQEKKKDPLMLYSSEIQLQYGLKNWYMFSGDLSLTRGKHKLNFSGTSKNTTSGSFNYDASPDSKIFDHSEGYSNLYSDNRGIYATNRLLFTYNYFLKDKIDLTLMSRTNRNELNVVDTFYRKFIPGLADQNYLRGKDSIRYLYQQQNYSMTLKLFPGGKDRFTYDFDLSLPKTQNNLNSNTVLYQPADTSQNTMKNKISGYSEGKRFSASMDYSHRFPMSTLNFNLDYSKSDYDYFTNIDSDFSHDSVPQNPNFGVNESHRSQYFSAHLDYVPVISHLKMPKIILKYNQYEIDVHRYLDSTNFTRDDTLLSNQVKYYSVSFKAGLSWSKVFWKRFIFSIESFYENVNYENKLTLPISDSVDFTYENFINNVQMSYTFKKGQRISLNYHSKPQYPGSDILSPYAYNNIPFAWSTGNLHLQQQNKHTATWNYTGSSNKTGIILKATVEGNYIQNPSKAVGTISTSDTTLANGWKVPKGTIFYTYQNFASETNFKADLTASFNIKKSSSFSLSPIFKYQSIPSSANGVTGDMEHFTYEGRIGYTQDIGKKFTFDIRYYYAFHSMHNMIGTAFTGDFIQETLSAYASFDFSKSNGFGAATSFGYFSLTGLDDGMDRSAMILSPRITYRNDKKFKYTIELELYDALNQNLYYKRSITTLYIEDRIAGATGRTLFLKLLLNPGILNKKAFKK